MKSHEQMAADVLARRDSYFKKQKATRRTVAAITLSFCCVCLIALAGFGWLGDGIKPEQELSVQDSTVIGEDDTIDPDELIDEDTDDSAGDMGALQDSNQHSSSSKDIHVNELEALGSAARLKTDSWKEDYWTWDEVTAYFGRDLRPTVLPETLSREDGDFVGKTFSFWRDKETDALVCDMYTLTYRSAEDAQPASGGKELQITVTKAATFVRDYMYAFDGEPQSSTVDGTQVIIGHKVIGSLYDENHTPTVIWDMYVATFTVDGVLYEIVTENMTLDELITVVKNYT